MVGGHGPLRNCLAQRWSPTGGRGPLRNTCLADGLRLPQLVCSGGRPKFAIDHGALRRLAEGRPRLQFVDLFACISKVFAPSKQFGLCFPQQLNRKHSYSDSVWPAFGGPSFLVYIYTSVESKWIRSLSGFAGSVELVSTIPIE